jgi:hypothetical protein
VRPKGVADGIPVNIPDLPRGRYHDGVTQKDRQVPLWLLGSMRVSRIWQANPPGHSTVRRKAKAYCRNAAEFTLPRKTSKENMWEPYLKPTQVDEENIHRRSREHSFRNSAN